MTKQELKEILAEQFSCDESELTPATTLEELGADQEDLIELAWQLGEGIGVEVDEDRLEGAETLEDLWKLAVELEEEAD
nr:acyl carrier protein [uncultured Gemmiger sp.]